MNQPSKSVWATPIVRRMLDRLWCIAIACAFTACDSTDTADTATGDLQSRPPRLEKGQGVPPQDRKTVLGGLKPLSPPPFVRPQSIRITSAQPRNPIILELKAVVVNAGALVFHPTATPDPDGQPYRSEAFVIFPTTDQSHVTKSARKIIGQNELSSISRTGELTLELTAAEGSFTVGDQVAISILLLHEPYVPSDPIQTVFGQGTFIVQ